MARVFETLTPIQIQEFRSKGFLSLPAVFTAEETSAWVAESRRLLGLGLAHDDNLRTVIYRASSGMAIVDRFSPVIDISPLFRSLTRDERILGPLRQLYNEDFLLFKDKLIYRMPGASGYPIHQDYSMWQVLPKNLVNAIVCIDAANADNGAVEFFPGHHHRLLSSPGEQRYMSVTESEQINFELGEVLKTGPGDIVIFDCLTPHRSDVNHSTRLRRQLYLTYSSAKNGDLYSRHLNYREEKYGKRIV